MTSRLLRLAALLGLALGAAGCGLAALTHDAMLGPVSPLGRVHEPTVGRDFRVTRQGPTAQASGETRLRPYPADFIRRLGSPSSFRALLQGLQAFAVGTSVVVHRREAIGLPVGTDATLLPGATAPQVLEILGPPDVWIRREGASLMAYRQRSGRELAVNLGVPPIAAGLVPIPGIANLAFRYSVRHVEASGLVLFFDATDRLVSRVDAAAKAPP